MVSTEQATKIEALEEALPQVPSKSQKFAQDLVRKGKKWNLSSKQMYWVVKLTEEATAEPTVEDEAMHDDGPDARIEKLKTYAKVGFAASLLQQYTRKGYLSGKQWEWVEKLNAEEDARIEAKAKAEAERIERMKKFELKHTLDKYDAVVEMFKVAEENLKKPKWNFVTPSGVHFTLTLNGNRDRIRVGGRYGEIDMTTGVYHYNDYAINAAEILPLMEDFKHDPVGVAAEQGHLQGACCFCARHLTDHRSTSHGYGPICAKRYSLTWDTASALEIQAIRAEKVKKFTIETHAKGWVVYDIDTGAELATFETSDQARAFTDEFTSIRVIPGDKTA
jgi:hypothetical protein